MTILVSVVCLIGIIVSLVLFRIIRYNWVLYDAMLKVYQILSFEFILVEECFQRIESSSDESIRYVLDNGIFRRRKEKEKPEVIAFLLNYMEERASLIEGVEADFSQEELHARRCLFEKLEDKYRSRFETFMSIDFKKQTLELTNEMSDEMIDKQLLEAYARSGRAMFAIMPVVESKIHVVLVRKKPGGKRPPKREVVTYREAYV